MLSHTDNAGIRAYRDIPPELRPRPSVRSYSHMKLLLALAIVLLIALSFLADYKWKKWIAARKQDRDHGN